MKWTLIFFLAFFSGYDSKACSVCGSSGGNQFLGLLPQSSQNFAGIQYQYRGFTSEHPGHGEHGTSTFSEEQYNALQAWGRYYVNKRFQVFAFVPYIVNVKSEAAGRSVISGLGDIMLLGTVNLLMPSTTTNWKHQLQAGAGIKIPTGAYDSRSISEDEALPNMQPGTRSWDFSMNANYTVRNDRIGINMESAYILTSENDQHYKYGNKLSAGLLAFYSVRQWSIAVLPQAGFKLDIASADYDNYTYKWRNDMTGGHQLYAVAGVQGFYRRIGCQLSYHQPVYQHFASGLVMVKYKIETGIYFLF